MHDRLAQKMGVHIGETMNLSKTLTEAPMLIRIAGFWKAKDSESEYWFNDPDQSLAETLLVRRNDYISRLPTADPLQDARRILVCDPGQHKNQNAGQRRVCRRL